MRLSVPIPVLAAASASVLGGTAVVATRLLVAVADAPTIAFLRSAGAAAVLAIVVFGLRGTRIAAADLRSMALLGVLMFGGFGFLFTLGLAYVPAARGAVVLATMPLLTLVLAAAVGRERLTWPKAAGGLVALAGVTLALGERAAAGPEAWRGDLCMALSAVLGAVHSVASGATMRRHAALPVLTVQTLAGSAVLGALALAQGGGAGIAEFGLAHWVALVWQMFFAGLFSYLLWFWALEHAPASSVTLTVTLNPISAAVFGAMFLAEPLTARLVAGLGCVVAGIVLANRKAPA